MAKHYLIVKELPSANKHLPAPLQLDEVVEKIENHENEHYVKIFHNEGKSVSIFLKSYFKDYSPKNKVELVKLIKNKGLLPS